MGSVKSHRQSELRQPETFQRQHIRQLPLPIFRVIAPTIAMPKTDAAGSEALVCAKVGVCRYVQGTPATNR